MSIWTDAEVDAADLAELVNGTGFVTTRYGDNPKRTWQQLQDEFDLTQAGEYVAISVDAANRAELAADQAMTAGWVYSTVADGEAVRVDEEYFWVVSTDSKYILELWEMGAVSATDTGKRTINEDYIYSVTNPVYTNRLEFGDFIGGDVDMRSGSTIIDLNGQVDLLSRGYLRGIQWRAGNDFARASIGEDIDGKYICGCALFYSENPANLPSSGAVVQTEDSGGTLSVLSNSTVQFLQLSDNLILAFEYGQANQVGATNILVGSTTSPADTERYATGFYATYQDSDFDPLGFVFQQLIKDKTRLDVYRVASSLNFTDSAEVSQIISDEFSSNQLSNLQDAYTNAFYFGDFVAGTPKVRSGSSVVSLNGFIDFTSRGLSRGLNLRDSGNEYVFTQDIQNLNGKYVAGGFYIYSESADFPSASIIFQVNDSGTLTPLSSTDTFEVVINSNMKLILYKGLVDQPSSIKLAVGSTYTPSTNTVFTGGYYVSLSDSDIDFTKLASNIFDADKARNQILINNKEMPKLILNGENEDSEIVASKSDYEVKRVIKPYPDTTDITLTKVFNFNGDYIDGELVKGGVDDVAPQRALGTTIGANHGFKMARYASVGHGKTDDDVGSVWEQGGVEFVIVGIRSADTIRIANRNSNEESDLTDGLFTHVSGGVNTSSFNATVITVEEFYPPFQSYSLDIFVDGKKVSGAGEYNFEDNIKFLESYDVLERSDVMDWYVSDRAPGEIYPSGKNPAYYVINTYEFNEFGDCSIHSEVTFLKAVDVQDLMFLQAQKDGLDRYYIPKSVPFNQGGTDFNFSLIEPSNAVSISGAGTVNFTASKMESGEIIDRYIGLNDVSNTCFAMGYLPIYSAEDSVRIPNTTNRAWEIRGSSDKMYPRVLDKGNFVSSIGETYAVSGYRNVFKKPSDVTSFYVANDYVYIDVHNESKVIKIDVDAKYSGMKIEVVDSRNATLISQVVSGSITFNANCLGDYGYMVLKLS